MTNEVPDSTGAALPDAKQLRHVDLLRILLDTPKPKDESWQSEAGRAVSMLAVEFLNESDDKAALRAVALLGLAQSLGVKEARKRAIKLFRWSETAPPPLTTLVAKDEQQAALAALARLTSAWSRSYAEYALADLSLSDELVPEILKWVRGTYADNLSFTQDFYGPQVAAAKSTERTLSLLKDGAKLLKIGKPETAVRLAQGLATLADALLQAARYAAADDKTFASSLAALLHVFQEQATAFPAVLFQPAFVISVGRLAGVTSKGAASKQMATVTDALSLATISLLIADIERNGSQAADYWRVMLPIWHVAYQGWDASVALATVTSPALAALMLDREKARLESSDAYATEAVFARLLPAWDAFVAELPDANRAASLSAMIQQAAGTVGIVSLGEKGAVVRYDPLSHHLVEEKDESPGQVRIVRPGVQVQRPDGSSRVLVAALVAAV